MIEIVSFSHQHKMHYLHIGVVPRCFCGRNYSILSMTIKNVVECNSNDYDTILTSFFKNANSCFLSENVFTEINKSKRSAK